MASPLVPAVAKYIQLEETADYSPGSESMIQKVAGSINYILDALQQHAVGEVLSSMLTEAQFQAIMGTNWVLCDGRDVSGSVYEQITGDNLIPDARGLFLRNQQGSRTDGNGNPDGNLAVGTYSADSLASHSHASPTSSVGDMATWDPRGNINANGSGAAHVDTFVASISVTIISASDGAETQPDCVTTNWFIRIN